LPNTQFCSFRQCQSTSTRI